MGAKRRFYRALDVITVRAARGMLHSSASWLLNTALVFLKKASEEDEQDDDSEWLWQFGGSGGVRGDEAEAESSHHIEQVIEPRSQQDMQVDEPDGEPVVDQRQHDNNDNSGAKPKVRPI